jgi:hypothetical protein
MKQLALATIILFTTAMVAPTTAIAQTRAGAASPFTVPVIGTPSVANTPGGFVGTLQIQRFATQDNKLVAVGLLTGMVTQVVDGVTTNTSIVRTVTLPAAVTGATPVAVTTAPTPGVVAAATCDILNLVLGPLHLDLLGLVVDLNQVVLNITAESGAGNLLGNLLCSVTGLLDSPGGLARLLNQILGILG